MFLFSLFLLFASVVSQKHTPCCGPTQFETLMGEFGEAYNPATQTVTLVDDKMQLYYDWDNKRIAAVHHVNNIDGTTESYKVVTDYLRMKQYTTRDGDNCTETVITGVEMPGPCIPHNATYVTAATMGYDTNSVKFETWSYDVADTALSVTLDVAPNGCVPVLQTIRGTDKGDKEAISHSYSNYVLGIEDPAIFNVPFNCPRQRTTELPQVMKRAMWAFGKFFTSQETE